jgi:hypothetical protein
MAALAFNFHHVACVLASGAAVLLVRRRHALASGVRAFLGCIGHKLPPLQFYSLAVNKTL